MSLFAELRRRNVFRIGVAYLVVAWLLMQVAALAAPALLLPEWVTTFVVFLLLLGFPVALLLAWAYEVTPEGVKKTKDLPADTRGNGLANRKLDFVVIGLLAIALVVLLFDHYGNAPIEADTAPMSAATETGVDSSIAVLPFINMSDDPNQEHFADGLTEELLNSLAGIEELRVISRTSAAIMSEEDGNWWFARVPAAVTLGERDLAIDILEQVEGETPRALRDMRCVPEIRSLAGNPRYDALLERLDLPE